MGLFNKAQSSAPPSTAPAPRPESPKPQAPGPVAGTTNLTIIAKPATVSGRITGSGDFRIEGRLEGELDASGGVTVAESGSVKGDLHGRTLTVAGTVKGNVSADERVELKPTAKLKGNITAPRMHIAEGATFEGKVFMSGSGSGRKDGGATEEAEKKGAEKGGEADSGQGPNKAADREGQNAKTSS